MAGKQGKSGDYEVGKGKTPKHTRWKPGQSGNPSGKRKREESLREKARRLAAEELVINRNGAPATVRGDEAILLSVRSNAMKGHLASARFFAELTGTDENTGDSAGAELAIGEAEIAVMETHAGWLAIVEAARMQSARDRGDPSDGEEVANDDTDAF